MKMRKIITLALILFASGQLMAQSEAMYAQYMFNGLAINPAYAGSQQSLSMTFLSRFQSVGIDGAPNTQTLSGHSAFSNGSMGLGLTAINDKIGVTRQTGVFASYAYKIKFTNKSVLSFGLQAGSNFVDAKYSQLRQRNLGDPSFEGDIREVKPNFGAGIFYSSQKFFVGAAMPQMLGQGKSQITVYNPIMLHGGYVFDVSPTVKIKPNFLLKAVDQEIVEVNINTNVLLHEVLWLGVSYRHQNSLHFLMEIQATNQLRFGYAFESGIGDLAGLRFSSHEFVLNYRLQYTKKGAVDPRYF